MGHFDESIFRRPNIEIDIAGAAKRIVLTETRERHDFRALRPGGPNAIQNIWRRSGRTDRDQHIASAPMPFNLTGEDALVSEIISKACQGGAVEKSKLPCLCGDITLQKNQKISRCGYTGDAAYFPDLLRSATAQATKLQ
jgi:hypothetical protein